MNRKLLVVIIIILLSVTTFGCNLAESSTETQTSTTTSLPDESIAQRLDVEPHIEAEYVSDTGISTIKVNAEVVVPEAYAVDIYEAIPRAFTDEEVLAFIERHQEGLTWTDQTTNEPYDGHAPQKDPSFSASELGYDLYRLWILNRDEYDAGRDYHSIHVQYGIHAKTGKLAWPPQHSYLKSRFQLDNPF